MKTKQILCQVRHSFSEVNKTTLKPFEVVVVKPLAVTTDNGWSSEVKEVEDRITIPSFIAAKYSSVLRTNNCLIVDMEYHVKDETEFTTKEGVKKHDTTGWQFADIKPLVETDLIDIEYECDIKRYRPSLYKAITVTQMAQQTSSVSQGF